MQSLAAIDPGNETYQIELSKLYAWLADAERSLGNLVAAIDARQKQIALLDAAIARGATDVDFRAQSINAHQGLGNALISHGDTDRGIGELQTAVDEARRLMPVDPSNKFWQSVAAGAQLDLASTLLSLGRADAAADQTRGACALVAAISGRNPVTPRLRACLAMRSRLALHSNASSQALTFAKQALASARSERWEDPIQTRYRVATAYRLLGDAYRQSGNAEAARAAWSSALASLPGGIVEQPTQMDEHALILERLGRSTEAQQLVSKLNAIGYRRLM
jgi:tetratricopeptide (TPR) repeat protein